MNTKIIHSLFEKIKYCLLTISVSFILMGLLSSNSFALTINNFNQSGEVNCALSSCEAIVNTRPFTENSRQKPITADIKNIPVFPIVAVVLGGCFIAFSFNQRKKLLAENTNLRMRLETLEEIVTK
jgi:hypothetical protein